MLPFSAAGSVPLGRLPTWPAGSSRAARSASTCASTADRSAGVAAAPSSSDTTNSRLTFFQLTVDLLGGRFYSRPAPAGGEQQQKDGGCRPARWPTGGRAAAVHGSARFRGAVDPR